MLQVELSRKRERTHGPTRNPTPTHNKGVAGSRLPAARSHLFEGTALYDGVAGSRLPAARLHYCEGVVGSRLPAARSHSLKAWLARGCLRPARICLKVRLCMMARLARGCLRPARIIVKAWLARGCLRPARIV